VKDTASFVFEDYECFTVKLPGFKGVKLFDSLGRLNREINFEYSTAKEEVIIRMGTFALISLLTGAILASLYAWAKSRNSGRVYTENGTYEFTDPNNPQEIIRRMPDVSYIDYKKASEEEQDGWKSYIPKSPSLAIEVVSSKYGLKEALEKMRDIWISNGTDVGLVICPFSKIIYVFELSKEGYKKQSIFDDVTHPILPGYKENFSEYAKKFD
jgi:Uma2 family endonuclease